MMGAMGESPFFSKDIAVIVGGKTYRPDSVEVTQDPFEDAMVKIEFRMNSFRSHFRPDAKKINPLASIEKVIFNPPATIVLWNDGTKTVVKAQDDEPFDPEKGLSMAIAKKYLGNKGNYFNQIKKWTEKFEEPKLVFNVNIDGHDFADKTRIAIDALKDMAKRMRITKVDRGV